MKVAALLERIAMDTMNAWALTEAGPIDTNPLSYERKPIPRPGAGELLVRVNACGVCRTDLHVSEGDLAPHRARVTPGHEIVSTVVELGAEVSDLSVGDKVGVAWLRQTCGTCRYCRRGAENLCPYSQYTGWDDDGGYAEYCTVPAAFAYRLPGGYDDVELAPLLCAGIIGFRALRVAGVQPGEHVGLYGFGSSAHLALPLLKSWGCTVSVVSRGANHRAFAEKLGADWVGNETARPPQPLDRAVTFAPAGAVVVAALGALRKGGVVAINAIHLDCIPRFDYDSLLWGERQIRSVANMTRADARDFLEIAAKIGLKPQVTVFPLDQANEALAAVKKDQINGAAVITI